MDSAPAALLSVYDKTNVVAFAKELVELGWRLYASGGTAKAIEQAGLPVSDVAELVGGEAILGHRVVTLSREIAAGLLADKASPADLKELTELKIPLIDLVYVDMYPLEAATKETDKAKVTELTDIGGPTMLRAAAKGRRVVVSNADQTQVILDWLKAGRPNEADFLEELAARAEYEVARYVMLSASYLGGTNFSGSWHKLAEPTKYGENPIQAEAAFYADNRLNIDELGLDQFEHVQGMELSYVNMTDIDRLLQTITHIAAGYAKNFVEVPKFAVGVKHGNACGAGISDNLVSAIEKMILGDTRAIFGGVVMINGPIDEAVASSLMHYAVEGDKPRLLDGVIGSSVDEAALKLLNRHKLRVVVNPALAELDQSSLDNTRRLRPVRGGLLAQPNYSYVLDLNADYMEYYGELSDQQKRDLVLAWAIGCTSNSNTITLVKNGQLIGNGVGQQDRVGASQLALTRSSNQLQPLNKQGGKLMLQIELDQAKLDGASAYSDSFFPFPDGPSLLANAGIKAILSSSGSVGDPQVIETLSKAGVSLAMAPDKIVRGFYMH